MDSDAYRSVRDGYASRRQKYYPFLDEVNREIARTHHDYTSTQDDVVFWWGTSAFYNKQVVRGTFRCIDKYGLDGCPAFKGFLPFLIKWLMPILETMESGIFGGLIGTVAGGALGAAIGTVIGVATEANAEAIEDGSDDLSLLLEGSTRTRANILTYRNSGAMLSSIQNFRAGQFNFQSNVNQATLNGALSIFTSSGFEGLDISDFYWALGGIAAGATVGMAGVGAIAGVVTNEAVVDGKNPFGGDEDGPGWWTGYWALPRVVQHRSAAIIMYDFADVQEFLAETGSHVWFPKAGVDKCEEARTSAYDDDNVFLADIDNIGPKGFWLFGKVVHRVPGVPVMDRPEGYIAVFSNQRPEWLSLDNDEEIYERRMDEASEDKIDDLEDGIDDQLDELEDEDTVGYIGRQLIEIAAMRAAKSTYQANIDRNKWVELAKLEIRQADSQLVQKRLCKIDKLIESYIDLWNLERVWKKPLPRDYFADRDWYVNGKNIWIVQIGSKDEYGSYEAFKERVTSAKVTIDDSGDMECTYHMPLPGGGSESIAMKYEDGGEFHVNDQPFQTDLYPRFENPFLRSRRAEWGQRAYVIEYRGKLLLHDFSDFNNPRRAESLEIKPQDANVVKAFVIFLNTGDEELEEFTMGTASIHIGCQEAAAEQVIAAGPAGENTYHDAEWIFCDRELTVAPDLTLTFKHHAFGEGDDDTAWKARYTLRALMGDYTLRDCAPSFPALSLDEDRQTAGPFPFSVQLSRWHSWEAMPDSRAMRSWFIADRPRWDSVYYDYVDLLALDREHRFWHRQVNACFFGAQEWRVLPNNPDGPSFGGDFAVCAISTWPQNLLFFAAQAGKLFATWLEGGKSWGKWVDLDPWIYQSGLFGLPDTSLPPIHIATAARGPVFAGPSTTSAYAVEVFFLGADGNFYGHHAWQPWASDPWQKIEVNGFSVRAGSDAQVAGGRMFVLSINSGLWASSRSGDEYSSTWEMLSPIWLEISRFAVFSDQGIIHVLATAMDGSIWAMVLDGSQVSEWIALGKPGGSPVAREQRVTGCILNPDRFDIFAVASDGNAYTAGWSRGGGWNGWRRPLDAEQGFVASSSSGAAAVHRVNGQLEVFGQAEDSRFMRAWWS